MLSLATREFRRETELLQLNQYHSSDSVARIFEPLNAFLMEASRAPAQKRRRVEGEVDYIRDADIWLSDGNIIIAVEDPKDRLRAYALKCHRSVLARHSQVFNTLFTLPQSPEAEEEYDGAPVVRLADPYDDLKSLIQMLYDPLTIPMPGNYLEEWERDMTKMAGPLRLSAKYELDSFFSRLSDVLETYWPVSLDAWTERTETIQSWRQRLKDGKNKIELDLVSLPDPMIAIDLATSTRLSSVLPVAFYDLHVRTSLSSTITEKLNGPAPPKDPFLDWEEILNPLSAAQMYQLMRGREWLRSIVTRFMTTILPAELKRPPPDECTIARCPAGKTTTLKLSRGQTRSNRLYIDPLYGLQTMKEDVQKNLCPGCADRTCQVLEGFREYLWAEMPYFFGLEERKDGVQYGYDQYLPPDA
ncbi:hypothetical protein BDW22DRAFT_913487 [Trametopsis cervina]|nr:hypothetical protein BDW22DRAFT_913487 [Trametopsis cervina]